MLSVDDASQRIQALLDAGPVEEVALADASGRVLRTDAVATRNQPPFPASAMDGYAIRSADKHAGRTLTVTGAVAAGHGGSMSVGAGEAVRIFTGAPVPDGADTILIQEDATRSGDAITLHDNLDPQSYVRPAGTDFEAGFRMAAPRRLRHPDLALLASMNVPRITVAARPVVALIATGDELVWPGDTPRPDQIIASNTFGLKSMLEAEGADVRLMPIAPDTTDGLMRVLERAQGCDLIVTLGGASVGDHDLVKDVATSAGLDLAFYKLAMRPGKPLMAGKIDGTPMIGLPGNPVSAMVCGHIFVRPAISMLMGLPWRGVEVHDARLATDIGPNGPRAHYMRARVTYEDGGWLCTPFARQDSSLLSVLTDANALMIRSAHDPEHRAGDVVKFTHI